MAYIFLRVGVLGFLLCPTLLADEKAKTLDSLLQARQETLKKLLEAQIEVFRAGRSELATLADPSRQVRDAEIERTINPVDRLAAHERHVKQMREFEKVVEAQFEAGRVAVVGLAEAKRQRLEAELDQVRERLLNQARVEDAARERALHGERREVLETVLKARLTQFEAGRGTLEGFLEVSRRLLEADLESTNKRAERLALYERHLKLVEKCAEGNEARFKAARLPLPDFAAAKADHLADTIRHLREKAGDKPTAEETARIRKLLDERRDTLRQEVEARKEEFDAGRGLSESLLNASRLLLQAELDLREKPEERLAAHQTYREQVRACEKRNEALFEVGKRSLSELLQSRAARLEAEIGVVRSGGKIDR